jgi:hypothetical protein
MPGPTIPIQILGAALAFGVTTLAIPRSVLRNTVCSALLGLLLLQLPWPSPRPASAGFDQDHHYGNTIGTFTIFWIANVLLSNPERSFPIVGKKDAIGGPSWWQRFAWSGAIWLNPRAIGWSNQAKNVQPGVPIGYDKWRFAQSQLFRLVTIALILVPASTYASYSPQAAEPSPRPIIEEPFYRQIFLAWVYGAIHWGTIEIGHVGASILTTLLGLYEPWQWPPLFGRWKDGYSVRRMWGVVWHQNFRQMLSIHGLFIARDVLGLRKGSFASKYVQLAVAFALSAVIHEFGSVMASGHDCGEWRFFLSQVVAIFIEDQVVDAAAALGIKGESPGWKVLGYVWVFAWFSYSMRLWADGMVRAGIWMK